MIASTSLTREEQGLLNSLTSDGLLDRGRRSIVEHECARRDVPLGDWLVDVGFIDQATLQRLRTDEETIAFDADEFVPDARAVACLDAETARRLRVLPLTLDVASNCLTLVIASRPDLLTRDRVRRAVTATVAIQWRHGPADEIARAIDRCYGVGLALADVMRDCDLAQASDTNTVAAAPSPIVRLIDALLADALVRRASDIHINPEACFLRVRYRVDGVLEDIVCLQRRHLEPLSVSVKVLGGVDIAETRRPQDGRFTRRVLGRLVDFRLSTFPLCFGENIVLRVIDRRAAVSSLDALELPASCVSTLRRHVGSPEGLIVVAGPTGAGKTSTLYALLGEIDASASNVMTLEDPIEHRCPGVSQASLDAARDLDYARGVRALLRQDPDVLLIGEIRDAESCAMALRAALTGHLVLTTVHAEDAVSAIARLRELGARDGLLGDVLSLVVGQRLLRRRCTVCGDERRSDASMQGGFHVCSQCLGRGLFGRRALVEVLDVSGEFADAVRSGADRSALVKVARACGHVDLPGRARAMLAQGATTREEIVRVLGPVYRKESEAND